MPDPFHVRFNIAVPIEEARRRFVNRIANRVRLVASAICYSDTLDLLLWEIEAKLGEPHSRQIEYGNQGLPSFVERWQELIGDDFLRCLHALEGFYKGLPSGSFATGYDPVLAVNTAIAETFAESEYDVGVAWENGIFTRKGAEILDEKLVNEPLRWLADPKYQNVLVPFQKGLSHLLEGTKDPQRYGDAVTDMYEALEAIGKMVTGKPARDLSALREELIAKLRLPDTHKAMLKEYIDYGCDFRHAVQTHGTRTWPLEHEAENFVYLTGLFIRLAIQAEKV
jgi:hypothetical protein